MRIHPTAIVEAGAKLHPTVRLGPYSIIESGAELGEGCVIETNVRIYGQTRMGMHNRVCHGASIGSEPQDLSYTPEKAKPLRIGDHNHFKEGVNISHGIKEEHGTVIGNRNYFMAYSHVGHDCIVGDHNIFANNAVLGGHVELAHHVFLSGHTAVHQFCRIGPYAIVAGVSGVAQDVPPFTMVDGHRAEMVGLNVVGLRRGGFSPEQRNAIKQAYRLIYRSGLRIEEAVTRLANDDPGENVRTIIYFIKGSKRGLVSHRRRAAEAESE
jgi:UDP-N-acetylglucosamine acyltransferase